MTYNISHHKQFLAYRAQGETYDQIAAKMNVNKNTLLAWAKKYRAQLAILRAIELENLQDKFALTQTHRLKVLGQKFLRLRDAMPDSDLQRIPPAKRFELMLKIIQLVHKQEIPPDPKPNDPDLPEDEFFEPKPPGPTECTWKIYPANPGQDSTEVRDDECDARRT